MPKKEHPYSDVDNRYNEIELPDFSKKKAYICTGAMQGSVIDLLLACNFERAATVKEADVVVFVGGADVDPSLYGQTKIEQTYSRPERDKIEREIFDEAKKLGKMMFGICRGAQFLHVMAGGSLWQDVTNHAGPSHDIIDIEENVVVRATSLHHQACRLDNNLDVQLIATTVDTVTSKFEDENVLLWTGKSLKVNSIDAASVLEVEAAYYPGIKAFTVQGHPEVGTDEYKSWTMNKLHDLMVAHVFGEEEIKEKPKEKKRTLISKIILGE